MKTDQIQVPLGIGSACRALALCAVRVVVLLLTRRIHLPVENRARRLSFADRTTADVFRETRIDRAAATDPCVLVVKFRLRAVRGRGHALFRWESVLNTVLFAGFPGLISKLWLAHDRNGVYRGLYEWDGPAAAESYARALWRVLAVVSVPGSIGYHIQPGLRRADLFDSVDAGRSDATEWWRLTGIS
ncbi:hypothetical protein ABZ942_31170 [Nocardia sp. NPDC046473]|uniref:hypothetical protein n=1 Tax=Nocardia sp. NPDC046473 TaxID=3155733 RepID=UPI0033E3D44E